MMFKLAICLSCFTLPCSHAFLHVTRNPNLSKSLLRVIGQPIAESKTHQEDEGDYTWEIGNFEEDIMVLEQAIIRDNAQDNLKHSERLEMLDALAAQRRPLLRDVHLFLSRTMVWSLLFVGLQRLLIRSNFHRLITLPWDIHFWLVVVLAPILFLRGKRATMGQPPPRPSELDGLPPEYLKFMSPINDWEDPQTSCKDYVLCLAEQWVSAVKGAAGFAAARTIANRIIPVPIFSPFTLALLQFVTRLGAMVALFQFPKLFFDLQRSQQPRPVKADVAGLQVLVRSLFAWSMPVGLASDFSQLLIALKGRQLVVLFGMFAAFLSVMETRYNQIRKPPPFATMPARLGKATTKALESILTTGVPSTLMIAGAAYTINNWWTTSNLGRAYPSIPWLHWISRGALLLAYIRPIWHIIGFIRIIDIVYMHDLSLTTDPEVMQQTMNNPQEREKRYKWRSRLRWREPQRVQLLVDRAWANYWRWFFLSRPSKDEIVKEALPELEAGRSLDYSDSETVWARVKREMADEPAETPKPNRTLWKQRAMDHVASIHQKEYERGPPYSDPLGVALQQRLGIGLRFSQDHTRRLEVGEIPNTERLQTRAVKSAINEVNSLWTEAVGEKRVLEKEVSDPKEREEKLHAVTQKVNAKIAYLAKRVSELTPTTPVGEGIKFQFLGFTKPIMAGGRKLMISVPGYEAETNAVDRLLDWYEAEILGDGTTEDNKMTRQKKSTQFHDYGADCDDFSEAYLKQRFTSTTDGQGNTTDGSASNNDD